MIINKQTVEFPVFKIKLKDRYIKNVIQINEQKKLQLFWMEFHTTENYQQIVQRLIQVLGKPSLNNFGLYADQMSWGIENNGKYMPIVELDYVNATKIGYVNWKSPMLVYAYF